MFFSALFAAFVAIFATVSIEKWGGKLGGLLSSLPSTVVPASMGFWFSSQDIDGFQAAICTVPLGMFVNAMFLFSWRVLPPKFQSWDVKKLLPLMIFLSLLVWSFGAFLLVTGLDRMADHIFWGWFGSVALLLFGVWACQHHLPSPKGSKKVSLLTLLSRGVLAGLAIGFAVFLSSLGSSVLAGMASVFPAIFLTTMVSIWVSQGHAVQAGAIGPMMLGSSSVAFFAMGASLFYPMFGAWWGALLAWIFSVGGISVPAWFFLQRKSKNKEE